MNKDAAHKRLIQAIDYLKDKGMARNHDEIADLSGIKRPNVTAALNGDFKRITEGNLRKFASAYSDYINEDWLLTGEGRMEKPSKNMRPHYPATVEAGLLGEDSPTVMDHEVEMEPVIKHFPSYDYMIDISGRSMEPAYFDGDTVACRRIYDRDELIPGKTYVFATRDGAVIKRFLSLTRTSIRVSSDNPDYKPYNIDQDSIIAIAAVVGSIHNNDKAEEYMREAMLNYAKSVYLSKIENSQLSEDKRKELIKLITNND